MNFEINVECLLGYYNIVFLFTTLYVNTCTITNDEHPIRWVIYGYGEIHK